jgi:hypothetical protein
MLKNKRLESQIIAKSLVAKKTLQKPKGLSMITLSVLQFTAYDYPFGILWPLYCLSFSLRLMITPLVSCGHCVVCPSVYGLWLPLWYLVTTVLSVLQFTAYDYPFGILWPLCCLSFSLRLMITPLVSCGHCVVCPSVDNTVATRYQRGNHKP